MVENDEKIVKSVCRMCHGVCGVLVHLKNNRVVKITGDPDCPTSNGYICVKGQASPELLYHPDRLKYPLKRVGHRGENKWERISWEEALDTIAYRLASIKRDFGAESVVGTQGTGRPYTVLFQRFLKCLGTPNMLGNLHVCYAPRISASMLTSGDFPICDYYGFGGTYPQCVLVWGCNITETGAADGMCGYQLTRTLQRGAKLIVVDPRKTDLASKANLWLQIRPGTDGALAMGMLYTIIEEELYDKDFVERWSVGFNKLKDRVMAYPREKVEEITWVSASAIREATHIYANSRPACLQWGNALDQGINSFQSIRAIHLLSGICGNIDVPGGDVFWVPPERVVGQNARLNPDIFLPEKLSAEVQARRIGTGKYRILDQLHPFEFISAVMTGKPYPVKAFFIMGSNKVVVGSDCLRLQEALKKIDFIAAIDLFLTPTNQMADIVLPAASWLEIDDVADIHFVWCVLLRQKVSTIAECRDDKDIIIDLAHRMGMQDSFPWKNAREYCDWLLKGQGITFDDFKQLGVIKGKMRYLKHRENGFATPSGKFEIYSSVLENMGYDPLPGYIEPPESPYSTPELFKKYPLVITTGSRTECYFHSEGRQIKSLRRLNPDPLLEIHSDTARNLNIKDGDWVWIENSRGRIKQRAKLTSGIHPRVVHAQHGWWFPEKAPPEYGMRESNINLLTGGMPCDPHTGSESWRSFLCKVYKT